MPDDPLFPHGPMTDLFPRASLPIDMGKYGRPVKYPRGLMNQGDFRPIPQPARRAPVVQAQPPPPRSGPSCPVCSVPGRTEVGMGLICPICGRRVS